MNEQREGDKIMRTYRFYPATIQKLQELAQQEHRTSTNMIEYLINLYYGDKKK